MGMLMANLSGAPPGMAQPRKKTRVRQEGKGRQRDSIQNQPFPAPALAEKELKGGRRFQFAA
jgi:hypothetical protein